MARTALDALSLSEQDPKPEHAPDQRLSSHPAAGLAASRTRVFGANWARQVLGHATPRGTLVTLPLPVTATMSVRFTNDDEAVTEKAAATSTRAKATIVSRREDMADSLR